MNAAQLNLAAQLRSQPWAMSADALRALTAATDAGGLRAASRRRPTDSTAASAGVQVISVRGYLVQHPNLLTYFGLGTSAASVSQQLRIATLDDRIDSILLDVDCNGGECYGMTELASEIRQARAAKPVTAIANSVASGAGYWIASAATQVYVTPGGEVGGVGLSATHEDCSAAIAKAGINVTLISAGKHKVEGNPYGPLGSDARGAMQASVDRYHQMMASDIARGRGISVDKVRSDFGQGRALGAKQAKAAGLVDRVATFDDVLSDMTGGRTGKRTGVGASSLLLSQIALARAMRS